MDRILIVNIFQVVISIVLIAVILLQQKGTGLGGAFGGEGNIYRTRRGLERGLFAATILGGIGYAVLAILAAFFIR